MLKNTAISQAQWTGHNSAVNAKLPKVFLHSLNFLMVLMKVPFNQACNVKGVAP